MSRRPQSIATPPEEERNRIIREIQAGWSEEERMRRIADKSTLSRPVVLRPLKLHCTLGPDHE